MSDGLIGSTAGLQVEVVDREGRTVATLDVGAGYSPGTELTLPGGLAVSFTFGELSATNNDAFVQNLIADSDTSDVLAAFGLNSLFVGTDAATFGVRDAIVEDPFLLSTSGGGDAGDNKTLLRLLDLQHKDADGLATSFSDFHGNSVGRVGFEVRSADNAAEAERFLADSLTARREQVSGVNVDEELVNLILYEQAFTAASRFIQTISAVTDEVMNLL